MPRKRKAAGRKATNPSPAKRAKLNPKSNKKLAQTQAMDASSNNKAAQSELPLPVVPPQATNASSNNNAAQPELPLPVAQPQALAHHTTLYPSSMDASEPLCMEVDNRFVLFPIKNQLIWDKYKHHVACFWTVGELDLSKDHQDWEGLKPGEQHFIKYVLAFFAASDGIVLENLTSHFINDVKLPEARCFYAFQAAMENVHSETYSLLIDTYIKDEEEKTLLFNAMDNIPCISAKAQWALKWMSRDCAFALRLVAFACVEGSFFSGSFCALFWLKKRGKMRGLTHSNELIARDEGLHTEFACLLYKQCKVRLDESTFRSIMQSAVECEMQFVCDSLPVSLIGLNVELMEQHIKYMADHLCYALGHKKIYGAVEPFEWFEAISLEGKTNFFDTRVSEYQMSGVKGGYKASAADRAVMWDCLNKD